MFMVTYCTGNIAAKRRDFRSKQSEDTISVDNDEVLATFTLNKKLYVVVGTTPFSNTRLGQFIAYSRALKSRLPLRLETIKSMLKCAGVRKSICAKMGSLDSIDYRAARLVSQIDITTKTIYVNFDGLEYTHKNAKKVNRYLRVWGKSYDVFVAVSDSRFIPQKAAVINYTKTGTEEKRLKTRNRTVSTATLKRRLKRAGMDMNIPQIKTVVVCDA